MREELLGLLAKEPAHGYELKQALEADFGDLWPTVNIGQIYSALARLETTGLVRSAAVTQDGRPDKKVFELTAAGRDELQRWVDDVVPVARVRDRFFVKLVLAARAKVADPVALIDRQRRAYLRRLRQLNDLAEDARGMAARLAVQGAVLHLQADLKWLEQCEQALSEGAAEGGDR
ncbi:MAG TPA: helix-turn-helix transcriptional regulator [Candidatus Limnocylindrales bacterium]